MTRRLDGERLRVGAPLTQVRGLPSREPLPGLSDNVWEAPMGLERTSVGLDVHARSVSAAAIDGVTGELFRQRLVPDSRVVIDWVRGLPGPVAVTYEAGPTGFGLARALTAAGMRCEVAAPSKIPRPAGDRVKTDARDALLLARLLRLDEIVPVRVPTVAQESARDLVRAREDARADLMRVRHRISKLLLRHGHVYAGGEAWTGKHEAWLRGIGFPGSQRAGTQAAYDADLEALALTLARRQRLDRQIAALAPAPRPPPRGAARGAGRRRRFPRRAPPVGLPAGDLHADRVRPGRGDRRLVPVHRRRHRRLPGAGDQRDLHRSIPAPGRDHQDRQQPCPPAAGRGRLAARPGLPRRADPAGPLGTGPGGRPGPRARRQPAPARPLDSTDDPQEEAHRRLCGHRPRAGRLVLVVGHPARPRRLTDRRPRRLASAPAIGGVVLAGVKATPLRGGPAAQP